MNLSAAMRQPLLAGDPAALTRKLAGSSGLLREYGDDFQRAFRTDANMCFLPALLTGEGLAEARAVLRRRWAQLAADDGANDVQFHTWCRCGAVLRQAVFFDWLAARSAWAEADLAQAAASLVGFAFQHPFLVLQGRTRTSNNQSLAMALTCAVIGFLFGHKLARHPTARLLFDEGLGRLPDLLGLFPADGYGGEGSTYTSHVNTPLLCWTADFLEQVTGRDWWDTPFRPNGTTLRVLIEMERRLVSPGGWLPAWDHYGWQRAIHGAPFAYLARRSGNPRYLALIPAVTEWSQPGSLAWGADDPLWTLVWWPAPFADYAERAAPAELFGWFLPRTGAALDDVARRARLMQVWDRSAAGLWGVGRAQCDPNQLLFEYAGEPVFQDGVAAGDSAPWPLAAADVLASLDADQQTRFQTYVESFRADGGNPAAVVNKLAPGLIGAANVIVVDNEPWYWPGGSRVGRALHYTRSATEQIVSADSAAFYQPRYDVTRAQRTSWWSVADGYGVVWDALAAQSAHTWQWQAHLRPEVTLAGDTAQVKLAGGTTVLLAWAPVATVQVTMLTGFPRTHEQRCARLELVQTGATAEFAVVIAPAARTAGIWRVADGEWEVTVDGRTRRLTLARPVNVPAATADVMALEDVTVDCDWQFPEFEPRGVTASAPEPHPLAGAHGHPTVDTCLAQLAGPAFDEAALRAALRSDAWPVRVAAVEVLGRQQCQAAAPVLRAALAAEHADPQLYGSGQIKRWRLKLALIVALGRLGDRASVPLLGQILAEGRDFYLVNSVAAQALGRIGGPAALAALAPALNDHEENTRIRAVAARDHLERTTT